MSELQDRDYTEAINIASGYAGAMIRDFATRYDKREDYQPIEALAADVQKKVLVVFCNVLRDKTEGYEWRVAKLPETDAIA